MENFREKVGHREEGDVEEGEEIVHLLPPSHLDRNSNEN